MKDKLKSSLEVLILKGCLANIDRKSIVIREMWRYCGHNHGSVEMMFRELTPFNLVAEQHLMDLCLKNCKNLKCLRLSYCQVKLNLFERLRRLSLLSCLHLEYIYGIESSEEWTEVGRLLSYKLYNFSYASDCRHIDISGMLSELGSYDQLALEEYKNDMSSLFSSLCPNVYTLSLINYYNLDSSAFTALSERLSTLKELNITYDSFHSRRANTTAIFNNICLKLCDLRKLQIKMISAPDMRPLFKLTSLKVLDLQFSIAKFIDFSEIYHMDTLRYLYLTKVLLTPKRLLSLTRAFPYLIRLSLSGSVDRNHIDSAMFCCECRGKDKTHDTCPLCYQNCVIGLTELEDLERLELHFITIKPLLSVPLPYIPNLNHLVINPFECLFGRSLLLTAMKIAQSRPLKFVIRKIFIKEVLEEEYCLPTDLEIVDYQKEDNETYFYN